jgi:hypothetical protein
VKLLEHTSWWSPQVPALQIILSTSAVDTYLRTGSSRFSSDVSFMLHAANIQLSDALDTTNRRRTLLIANITSFPSLSIIDLEVFQKKQPPLILR